MKPKGKRERPQNTSSVKQLLKNGVYGTHAVPPVCEAHVSTVQSATNAVSPLVPFCDILYPQAWEFQVEKCLTSIDKRMQKKTYS